MTMDTEIPLIDRPNPFKKIGAWCPVLLRFLPFAISIFPLHMHIPSFVKAYLAFLLLVVVLVCL